MLRVEAMRRLVGFRFQTSFASIGQTPIERDHSRINIFHGVPKMADEITITTAGEPDLEALVGLFDAYRMFYTQSPDPASARAFLTQRLSRRDSTIFIARRGDAEVGFTQLYPTFSSVKMARVWTLNDLYVDPSARRQQVGERLIERAVDFARGDGAIRLELATGVENYAAQALYAKLGWERVEDFLHYNFRL